MTELFIQISDDSTSVNVPSVQHHVDTNHKSAIVQIDTLAKKRSNVTKKDKELIDNALLNLYEAKDSVFTKPKPEYAKGQFLFMEHIKPTSEKCLKTNNQFTYSSNKDIIHNDIQPRIQPIQWGFYVLVSAFILVVFVRREYSKYFSIITNLIVFYHEAKRRFENYNLYAQRFFNLLQVNFILISGLYILQVLSFYHIKHLFFIKASDGILFIVFSVAVFLYFLFKKLIYILTGHLFNAKKEALEYIYHINVLNAFAGLSLLPITIGIAYFGTETKHFFIICGYVMLATLYLIRLYRGSQILFNRHISFFHVIVYLCTLEIIPLLAIIKGIMNLSLISN